MFGGLTSLIFKEIERLEVYASVQDGSFDIKDKKRLKPFTRLRKSINEIEQERSGDINLRLQDWLSDIEKR